MIKFFYVWILSKIFFNENEPNNFIGRHSLKYLTKKKEVLSNLIANVFENFFESLIKE